MKNINNEKGTILIITAGFVLVFTMVGFASIHFAMLQNELAEKQKNSTQAFWLADGALEIAKANLPAGSNEKFSWTNYDVELPEPDRVYDLNLKKYADYNSDGTIKYQYSFKWRADSFAKVNGQKREIEALISRFEIPDQPDKTDSPIISNNPVDYPDNVVVPDLSVKKVFDISENIQDVVDSSNYFEDSFEGADNLIYVEVKKAHSINLQQPKKTVSSFIVVDTTKANKDNIIPVLRTSSSDILRGILFVIGNAELAADVNGIVFSEGQLKISGTGKIINDPILIDQALKHLGATAGGTPKVVGWQEIVPKELSVTN